MHRLDIARSQVDSMIQRFSVSLMSNTKWVKLLKRFSSIEDIECTATVKLVWDDDPRPFRLDNELEYKFDFYDTAMESMIGGYPKGWYDYREIEWLRIKADDSELAAIERSLCELGMFELERFANGIKIYGYK